MNKASGDHKKNIEFSKDSISSYNNCQTVKAKRLCINEAISKLEERNQYDIGGTFTREEPDLWFFFTTSRSLKNQFLLNLFVYHRKAGFIGIGFLKCIKRVLSINEETVTNNKSEVEGNLEWKSFVSPEIDTTHYITTYCLTDLKCVNNSIFSIPIEIELNPTGVNRLAADRIRLTQNFSNIVCPNKTDYILESASRTQYPAHKIMLASFSPVLRDIIKNEPTNVSFLDISDHDMTLLLEFLNYGHIKDIEKQSFSHLLELSFKFKLERLRYFIEKMLANQLNIDNAVDFAVLSEKYHLDKVKKMVFLFIRSNPKVMDTEGWHKLEDVNLTKKLCKEVFRAK